MAEKLIIKRYWKNEVIRLGLDTNEIRIECSVDGFGDRLAIILTEAIVPKIQEAIANDVDYHGLAWTFRQLKLQKIVYDSLADTFKAKVDEAIRESFKKTVQELKDETVKIV